jgi:hypothetical protein
LRSPGFEGYDPASERPGPHGHETAANSNF